MPATLVEEWQRTLDAIATRNGTVELTVQRPQAQAGEQTQPPPTWRVRVLACDEQGVVVEHPHSPHAMRDLVSGATMRMLIAENDRRWVCQCQVLGVELFDLNAQTRVRAVRLTLPDQAESAQRRGFFRVRTIDAAIHKLERPIAHVRPCTQDEDVRHTLEASGPLEPVRTELLNISGGGVGLHAPQQAADMVHSFSHYRLTLALPTLEQPMELRARLVHLIPHDDGTHYLGMVLLFDDDAHRQRCEDDICRFAAWWQRQQLQRHRARR